LFSCESFDGEIAPCKKRRINNLADAAIGSTTHRFDAERRESYKIERLIVKPASIVLERRRRWFSGQLELDPLCAKMMDRYYLHRFDCFFLVVKDERSGS
jgi:hypothetical protein